MQSLREEILALAGVDKAKLAALTKKLVERLDEALDATRVDRASFEGEFTDERIDVDHRTRLSAMSEAADFIGLKVSKSAVDGGAKGPIEITVNILPASGSPPRIDVTPREH